MKILCVICQDLLSPSEDSFFTRCGHVFHHRCLLQWLERSKTCPQCRNKVTVNRIHKAHFTVSNTDITTDNADNSTLQGRIDSLQFQILLNEKNIKHYTSKNIVLEKQNAGLRQEVRKVESEMWHKKATICALKEQIDYFKEKSDVLKKKLSQKEKQVAQFQDMYKTLSTNTLKDVQKMVGNTTDHNTLVNYISIMKKIMSKKTEKIENLQNELTRYRESLGEERTRNLKFEIRLAFYENENLSLHQVNEREKVLTSDQNYDTKVTEKPMLFNNRTNEQSLNTIKTEDIQQINTKQENKTTDQNDLSTPEAEIEIVADTNQKNSMHNSTVDECPTVTKKAKLCLQSSNSSDETNDVIMNDVENTAGISSQSNTKTSHKKMLKLKTQKLYRS